MKDDAIEPDQMDALNAHRLFAGIDLEELNGFLSRLQESTFDTDEVILKEGDSGDRLYLIISGSVEVIKRVIAKETVDHETLAVLGPGETFGEMELVDLQPRSATVRAQGPVRFLSLSGSDLNILSIEDTRIFSIVVMNLAREISLRLRQTDTWLAGSLFSIRQGGQK